LEGIGSQEDDLGERLPDDALFPAGVLDHDQPVTLGTGQEPRMEEVVARIEDLPQSLGGDGMLAVPAVSGDPEALEGGRKPRIERPKVGGPPQMSCSGS